MLAASRLSGSLLHSGRLSQLSADPADSVPPLHEAAVVLGLAGGASRRGSIGVSGDSNRCFCNVTSKMSLR